MTRGYVHGGITLSGTADVAFTHGNEIAVDSDVVVEWDFDNDDDFSESIEDITSYVLNVETITGRDFPSQLTGKATPGQLRMTLDNRDGRFSFFNTSSPLNTAPNSLRVGRKVRLRTSESTPNDPVLLARDRFNRSDGAVGQLETGQTWLLTSDSFLIEDKRAVAQHPNTERSMSFSCGSNDHYVQATIGALPPFGTPPHAGVVGRRIDSNNFVYVTARLFDVRLVEVVSGTPTVKGTYTIWPWPGMTLGLLNEGSNITAYVNGVPVITDTTSLATSQNVGLYYEWDESFSGTTNPSFDDFYVFDGVVTEVEGILWTGDISDVKLSTSVDGFPTVQVSGEGFLARAALPDVLAPRAIIGARTGVLVGDALSKAGLLHPPATIHEGVTATGPVSLADDKALELARKYEETEIGFLHETQEGPIAFFDREARDNADAVVTFSDAPGAQFGFSAIEPYDQRREIVNRVTAGVAHSNPGGIGFTSDSGGGNVTVDIPTLPAGSLCVVVIASTVASSGVGWNVPIWWSVHRTFAGRDDDSIRTRVYSHFTGLEEAASTKTFYTNSGGSGGSWIAHVWVIEDWYAGGNREGVSDALFADGYVPPPLDHGWGRVPVVFIAFNAALTSVSGGTQADVHPPDGYSGGVSTMVNGSVNGFDVGLFSTQRQDVAESEAISDPFAGFSDFVINESGIIAVRGFNGPHAVVPTLKNPTQFEGSPGRFVTNDDVDSQDEQRAIRSHVNPSNLFASEASADVYGSLVLLKYSDDRPIVSITFPAIKNGAYRNQAIRRRVGHKIHLIAENDTVMGISGDFFIESINHKLTNGGKVWETSWELSPA